MLLFLCVILVLISVLGCHVNAGTVGLHMIHHFLPQGSKALFFAKATATFFAVALEVPLTSVKFRYKWFVKLELHGHRFA